MRKHRALTSLCGLVLAFAPGAAFAQGLDPCGCAASPTTLGAFSSSNSTTWPPGTTMNTDPSPDEITIPLPANGVLIFDSFAVSNSPVGDDAFVRFGRNAANTPVTLLVRGDVTVGSNDSISVSGFAGDNGQTAVAGAGGNPGPGGYGGGDAANRAVNLASDGGSGLGPGGGAGSRVSPDILASGGTYFGVPELRPMRGGSGGGGGRSAGAGCAGGGGGGGAGAILIAANGTISVGGIIRANGGGGGFVVNGSCDSGGAGGAGGAIRLVATTITGGGRIEALGGNPTFNGGIGSPGAIRMESITNSFGTNLSPVALRIPAPGPLVNPVNPSVAITHVLGATTPSNPQGYRGQIDMIVPLPGVVQVDLETHDVPAGTDVEITVKPKIGAQPTTQRITLSAASCASGVCSTGAAFDLSPGSYIVEARATFEAP